MKDREAASQLRDRATKIHNDMIDLQRDMEKHGHFFGLVADLTQIAHDHMRRAVSAATLAETLAYARAEATELLLQAMDRRADAAAEDDGA